METMTSLLGKLTGDGRVRKHSAYGPNRTSIRLKRHKQYGDPIPCNLDGNEKARLMMAAKAYNRRKKRSGEHGGPLTHATVEVLRTMLFYFCGKRGCWPGYDKLAEKAGVARSTVALALRSLEMAGFITVINRIIRVDHWVEGLFGKPLRIKAIERLSNSYIFHVKRAAAEGIVYRESVVRSEPEGYILHKQKLAKKNDQSAIEIIEAMPEGALKTVLLRLHQTF